MFLTNNDFLEDLDFGNSFKYSSKTNEIDSNHQNEIIFKYAPTPTPETFFQNLLTNPSTKKLTNLKKGTTTLAFIYKTGILIAVDSRASMGSYISSKTVRKVTHINSYLLGTIAGVASDCQFWERYDKG